MLFAILAAYLAYKRAAVNEKNPWLWAFIAIGVFIGTQLIVAFGAGILLGIGIALYNLPDTIFDTYSIAISFVSIIASFFTMWLLLRYLDKSSSEEPFLRPPPPTNFN